MRAWLALPKFRGDARFSTWLYRIASTPRTTCGPSGARCRRTSLGPRRPARPLRRAGARRAFSSALDALDESYRVAVVLYDVLGCSYAEIAEMTGVAVGTVKSRIFRGRGELAARLGTAVQETESNQ